MRRTLLVLLLAGFVAIVGLAAPAVACPFCSAVSLTFSQEIAQSQAAVIARLVEPPPAARLAPGAGGRLPKGKFQVVEVLKGSALVADAGLLGADAAPIETIMLEEKPVGTLFLLMGVEPPNLIWSSPIRLSDRAVAYIKKLADLAEKGPERLAFFERHLEDEDEALARDAYDEFAIAPYADVRGLKDRMNPAKLLGWIENPKVQANRRRLYATMLGVCGGDADAERIAAILEGKPATGGLLPQEQAEIRGGLDALIACYVTLRGPEAIDFVDRLFLKPEGRDVPFAETYAAVMALRFLGEESDIVPRERVLASLRLLLEQPKLADLVIPDLARWQDWSVLEKLVKIFKEAQADNIFVREPIVTYLRACPLPEAAAAVKEAEQIDPEACRRAAARIGPLAAAPDSSAADEDDPGSAAPPIGAATEDDAALAGRVAPVIGAEEGSEPPADTPAAPSEPPASAAAKVVATRWKWLIWVAVVAVIALVSRVLLRPGSAGRPAP